MKDEGCKFIYSLLLQPVNLFFRETFFFTIAIAPKAALEKLMFFLVDLANRSLFLT
ncbi:MAG TPA: hypothetical protein V6D28_19315 [Leptolyngbyaceae cyanobacterium]